jgi:3-oxoacyl-(acyl-carrier-protein) synthase
MYAVSELCASFECSLNRLLQEARKTASFAQYGLAAAEEALEDAGWKPTQPDDLEATVCGLCEAFALSLGN